MTWWEPLVRVLKSCSKCNGVGKPFLECRVYERYAPEEVEVLVVSESPPPGLKQCFLYNLERKDRLRKLLSRYFGFEEEELLQRLKEAGVFWSMAVKCRPPSKRHVEGMALRCAEVLALEVELSKPRRLVLLGSIAQKQYERLSAVWPGLQVYRERHPLYVVRFEKHRAIEYFKTLKRLLLGGD